MCVACACRRVCRRVCRGSMEWLKKIGEVNPDFKVVTFADSSCEHVYITPIGDYA